MTQSARLLVRIDQGKQEIVIENTTVNDSINVKIVRTRNSYGVETCN